MSVAEEDDSHGYLRSIQILEQALEQVAKEFADHHEHQHVVIGDFVLVAEAHNLAGEPIILRFSPQKTPPWRAEGLLNYALNDWSVRE